MNLDKNFSELIVQYDQWLKGNMQKINERNDLVNVGLPIAAATVWLKIKTNSELQANDFEIVKKIREEWAIEVPNVFAEAADIYTSNLAIYYVTLSEIKNTYGHNEVQKELTEIRDYIFDHMIRNGSLISSLKKGHPDFDLVLSVLPFGLFAPEDLIMVSAVDELVTEKIDLNSEEASLLGIYFTEKYDFAKAEKYLQQARTNMTGNIGLTDLLSTYLSNKKASISASSFIHKPLGNGNVYSQLPYERVPHFPKNGETCVFNVQVNIEAFDQVLLSIEGISEAIPCELIDPTLNIYQANVVIPESFQKGDYFFYIKGQPNEQSEPYHLESKQDLLFHTLELIGSNNQGNLYLCQQEQRTIFIELSEYRITVRQKKPEIHSLKQNERFASIDEHKQVILPNGTIALQLKESFMEIHERSESGVFGVTLHMKDDAQIYYGFGERYHSINQFGYTIDCFVYNQYRDQGTRTYIPMPYYFTEKGQGLYVATDFYTRFDLQDTAKEEVSIYIETENEDTLVTIELLHGTMKEMIAQYIHCTGEPVMIPKWALGPWMSSNNWDRESVVRKQIEWTNELDIPATVIVLEQWSDETTYYMFNDAQYPLLEAGDCHTYDQMVFPEWGRWPDPKGLIDDCHAHGLRFILWQIPIGKYLNQQRHPLKDQDEKYMIENGFVVKNSDGTPYRIPENWFTDSLLLDFTNEEAKKWWFKKRQYLIDIGVDGFKTDGGEMVYGADVSFADGRTGREMRNHYPKEYIKAYYEFAQQNNGITFSRSGYTGAHTYPAHWAGDERSTFDAFKRQLIAGINSGMSGVIFWGWDLGGFNGDIPTAELFMRSSSMAAFCPIMQYHAESKGEFNQDRTPWNIAARTNTPEVIDVYRFFANTRMNLLPYIYDQSVKAVREKQPLMRAMQIDHPLEPFANCYDQFMFGEALLVAPVIVEGATSREVTFPQGKWLDFWTQEIVPGGQTIKMDATVAQIPVYIKENSAILLNLGPSKVIGESIGNDLTQYTNAKLIVFASRDFEQTIHDHLGNTLTIVVDHTQKKVTIKEELEVEINWFEC